VFEPLVIWDLEDDPDGNVAHIAGHGITQDEVEEVVGNPANPTVPSDSSGRPITFGWTEGGRYLGVVWEHVSDDPRTIKPVTAFEAPPPAAPKQPRRKKR
jgi:hypothetical protein